MIAPRPRRLLLLPVALLLLAGGAFLPRSPAAVEGAEKVSLELYYESLCPYCSRFMVNHLAGIFEDGLIDAVDLRLVPYGNARVGANGDISCQGPPEKVAVALYYESLCPYSARFVVDRLAGVFEDGLLDAVDLTLVPYGNARVHPGGEISCQHGPYECLLNTVEACAIDAWPDLDVHFRFIYCVEDLVVKRQYKEWESCFQKLGLAPEPVTGCYKSEQGHKLELKYANQTDALVPPHRYVPWVVVDGQPLLEASSTGISSALDYENFEAYICKAYKGSPPKVCEGLVHPALQTAVARNGVTYNSGGIELATAEEEGRDGKIKMRLPDDEN
ncbi:gamma-interferon-inducible lysosomal thiol reductase-like [Panicum miliaceum]|uniref:Gamma-interferon-inducible lysosomal thiol reductase-like n=1 Tax=Panicum miliaceum TaxID=4540 RepID=A0A3L6TSG0_PANMI|nr:gamma-interferon-inducible lysosomal thiol reductase-like [Panicum miliaceum]